MLAACSLVTSKQWLDQMVLSKFAVDLATVARTSTVFAQFYITSLEKRRR